MQPFAMHQVTNQVGPLEDYSLFDTDPVLQQAVARAGAPAAELAEHGAWLGRAQMLAAAGLHGENLPAPAIAAILARAWPAIC